MKKIIYLTLLFILTVFTPSCKDEVEGCRDANAINYNAEADVDCNCCKYEGSVVLWIDSATSQDLISVGVSNLKFYLDGVYVGVISSSIFFNSTPSCSSPGAFVLDFDLGSSKSDSSILEVRDQSNNLLTTESITAFANTCTAYQL